MKQILIVDDSSSMRQMVKAALVSQGNIQVSEAGDGAAALEALQKNRYHLVISDVNMPRMNGIELLRQIKKDDQLKFTPVLMLTTEGDEKTKAEGRAAGAKAWMVKPFKPEKLVSAVSQLVV